MYDQNKYVATIVRWVDGDTVELSVDLGQSGHVVNKYRLARIDAPEIRRKAGVTASEKKAGLKLLEDLKEEFPVGTKFFVSTNKAGKYGRYLVEMYLPETGECLNDLLVERGRVKYY